MPNLGVDPLNVAAHILINLQEIQARELALDQRAVLTMGTVSGGSAPNVIPDKVVMGGSLRTYDEDTRAFVKARLREVAENTAQTFRASAQVTFTSGCPTLTNDEELSHSVLGYVRELLGEKKAFSVAQLTAMSGGKSSGSAGSEDFAYVSQQVPSIMLALAAGQPEKGYGYPQHHPMVKFDESALAAGSAVYAYTALRWLEDNSLQ
jgi:hippurate hydrolase